MLALLPCGTALQQLFLAAKIILHNSANELMFIYAAFLWLYCIALCLLPANGDCCGQQTPKSADRMHHVIIKHILCLWGHGFPYVMIFEGILTIDYKGQSS